MKNISYFSLLLLLSLLIPSSKMQAQLTYDGWSGGIQIHGLLPANEFSTSNGLKGAYMLRGLFRTKIATDLQTEIGFGTGKYTGLDDTHAEYSTNIFPVDIRLLYSPIYFKSWFPYVYVGGGALHYNVHKGPSPTLVSPNSVEEADWTGIIPFGLGAEFSCCGTTSFEVTVGATYTFTDNLNYYAKDDAKDMYYSVSVGLLFPRGHAAPEKEATGLRPENAKMYDSKVGESIVLEGIEFTTGSAQILPSSEETLQKVYQTLKFNPSIEVEIQGHTDNVGSQELNQKLSLERAQSVKNYLVEKGIDSARMTTKGYGEAKPIASNDTPEGRQKNRRIDFVRTK